MEYTPTATYSALRTQALRSVGTEVRCAGNPTRGLLMETGYPEAVVTLLVLEDGTSSLYFSNGGGLTGTGQRERPAVAARSLVSFAAHVLPHLEPTAVYPLPLPGYTRFYVITSEGIRTAEVREEDLGENRHALSPLFHAAHELITEMREAADNE